jgi:hypothetical protein
MERHDIILNSCYCRAVERAAFHSWTGWVPSVNPTDSSAAQRPLDAAGVSVGRHRTRGRHLPEDRRRLEGEKLEEIAAATRT